MHYFSYTFIQLFYSGGFITLRAKLSGAVYCNRSCLCVYNGRAGVVCVWVCYHDNSKLCTSIFTGSVYSDRLQLIQFWSPPGRGSAAGLCVIIRPARSVCVSPSAFFNIVIIIYCLRHLQYRGRGNKKSVKKMETLECPCWLKIVVEQDSELNRWMTTDNLRNRKALSLSLSRHLTGRRSFLLTAWSIFGSYIPNVHRIFGDYRCRNILFSIAHKFSEWQCSETQKPLINLLTRSSEMTRDDLMSSHVHKPSTSHYKWKQTHWIWWSKYLL